MKFDRIFSILVMIIGLGFIVLAAVLSLQAAGNN